MSCTYLFIYCEQLITKVIYSNLLLAVQSIKIIIIMKQQQKKEKKENLTIINLIGKQKYIIP